MSASSQARRDEEQRRAQRKDDVVIGKTSAKQDATNYELNTKFTEEEWMRRAPKVDQIVYKLTEEGMSALKMLNLEDANAAFDEVFHLKPDAYLWQAGIAKFYLDELEAAANLFAKNAKAYESKFGGRASEERIWRHACELKLGSFSKKKGRIPKEVLDKIRSNLEPIPDMVEDPDSLFAETRKVVRIASDLFESSVGDDAGGMILSRAKLRSIGGNFDDALKFDVKQWKLNAWYYLGLHYDAFGEHRESKECMKMALRNSPNNAGNGDNIVHVLPLLHMCQRDWFDDDDMDADPLKLLKVSPPEGADNEFLEITEGSAQRLVDADPVASDSIRKSIAKMNIQELQSALLVRGIKSSGSKKQLQERLFLSLMNDVGLAP